MKLSDIIDMWGVDAKVDKTKIIETSLDITKLHHKYCEIYYKEKAILRELQNEYKVLKRDKFEFYLQGPSKETLEKGWQYPVSGKILKSDIPIYMDADPDIINITLKIDLVNDKLEALSAIIDFLKRRSFHLNVATEMIKWQGGM